MSWFPAERVSEFLGAPLDKWVEEEQMQIRKIHSAWRKAYVDAKPSGKKKKSAELDDDDLPSDPKELKKYKKKLAMKKEDFLPKDSIFRSKDGDQKAPSGTFFRDFEDFKRTLTKSYWEKLSPADKQRPLYQLALTVVGLCCKYQRDKGMLVQNGLVPFRLKRDHVSPMALYLHELKMWCMQDFAKLDLSVKESQDAIRRRREFIKLTLKKEVFGDPVLFYSRGISNNAIQYLFDFISTADFHLEEGLTRAIKTYSNNSSRELMNNIKQKITMIVHSSVNLLYARFEFSSPSGKAETFTLNSIEGNLKHFAGNLNPENMALLLMFKLMKNPFIADRLRDNCDCDRNVLERWFQENPFIKRKNGISQVQVTNRGMPSSYQEMYKVLSKDMAKVNRQVRVYFHDEVAMKRKLEKVFQESGRMGAAEEYVESGLRVLSAIYELFPSLHALDKMFMIGGQGGNRVVFDSMKELCMGLMRDLVLRLERLGSAFEDMDRLMRQRLKEERARMAKYRDMYRRNLKMDSWFEIQSEVSDSVHRRTMGELSLVMKETTKLRELANEYDYSKEDLNKDVKETTEVIKLIIGEEEFSKLEKEKETRFRENHRKSIAKMKNLKSFKKEVRNNQTHAEAVLVTEEDGNMPEEAAARKSSGKSFPVGHSEMKEIKTEFKRRHSDQESELGY